MTQTTQQPQPEKPVRKPDDTGAITVSGHLRIFDPKTQETIVEKRA